MKNVSSQKVWMTGMNHPHVEPPPTPITQETHNGKSEKYLKKFKLHRYPTSSTSDLYEFKMSLFDNGDLEELLLLVCNFNMTLAASGKMEAGKKTQQLFNLVCREVLCQFDLLSSDVESTQTLNNDDIIKGLAQYFHL